MGDATKDKMAACFSIGKRGVETRRWGDAPVVVRLCSTSPPRLVFEALRRCGDAPVVVRLHSASFQRLNWHFRPKEALKRGAGETVLKKRRSGVGDEAPGRRTPPRNVFAGLCCLFLIF